MKSQSDLDKIIEKMRKTMLSKHQDYGPLNIALAPGGAMNGLRVRMYDKLARLNNLIESGNTPNHESIEDTLLDLANYAIIGILVQNGQWEGIPESQAIPRRKYGKPKSEGLDFKRPADTVPRSRSGKGGALFHKVVPTDTTLVRGG